MNSLIIYDNEGTLISVKNQTPAPPEPVGVPFLWVDVPNGKYVEHVNVSGEIHTPVFVDYPKSEIDVLKEQQADLWQIVLMGGF
ncbi:hypothetical protein [Jeotgalibacillus aurantiacus]|uniref:hypothetical protein n=1 Tax=Jeotgalibacillus aurantiacus TaxID=2763266 RepID=UPI001D09CDB2|nr:hypothetical protein [Jeotgalibacillus aurantiacus]